MLLEMVDDFQRDSIMKKYKQFLIFLFIILGSRVADSHHFNADQDPSFHLYGDLCQTFHFNADPDRILFPHQSDANL